MEAGNSDSGNKPGHAAAARAASNGQRRALRCTQQSSTRGQHWPAARAACAAAGSNAAEASRKLRANFGTFYGQAVAIGLASASEIGGNSEQWLGVFVLVAAGEEEEKKNEI